jgi:hypothetical protein
LGLTISQTTRQMRKKFTVSGILLRKQNGYFTSWTMSIVEGIQRGRVCYDFISHLLRYRLKTGKRRQSVKKKKKKKKREIINDPELKHLLR